MVKRETLVRFLDELLDTRGVANDYSNNGLQVDGADEIRRVIFSVDGSKELFLKAADAEADFIFVHHGISWGKGVARFTGQVGDRLRLLFCNDISLYGCHLPLDAHAEHGHNAVIARRLGLVDVEGFADYYGAQIGRQGALPEAMTFGALMGRIDEALGSTSRLVGADEGEPVRRVGVVSGSGISALREGAALGLYCLITGEMKHSDFHDVLEVGLPVILAGHYETEVPGVEAVMEQVRAAFDVECEFIDLPTGF